MQFDSHSFTFLNVKNMRNNEIIQVINTIVKTLAMIEHAVLNMFF